MAHHPFLLKSALVAVAVGSALPAQGADIRLSCEHITPREASIAARYTHTPKRATFDVSFKAPATANFTAQPALAVRIDGNQVGVVNVSARPDGSLGGSLSLDSYANTGAADPGATPFPASWPGLLPPAAPNLHTNSRVAVGPLGCLLAG